MIFTRVFEKLGSLGVVVSALGCAGCFPALGALGATLGLGFLSQYEGLFINTLLPLFALVVLLLNAFTWARHRVFWKGSSHLVVNRPEPAGLALQLLAIPAAWQSLPLTRGQPRCSE